MAKAKNATLAATQTNNGDKTAPPIVFGPNDTVVGIGSFHKSLPHNQFGEVTKAAFTALTTATASPTGALFQSVPPSPNAKPPQPIAPLTNPTAGLASDQLIGHPNTYTMPPAPRVLSDAAAAEMVELYWMALLRDVPFNEFETHPDVAAAVKDINSVLVKPGIVDADPLKLRPGIDLPNPGNFTPANLFRLGLPGEEIGPMVSQFFVRPVDFGTQTIDARQQPYRAGEDYLTTFDDWLDAQNTGKDRHGNAYPTANEFDASYYEDDPRYISTMRDLARFVNKDALHQAYFNAALLLLSGGAKWTPGNPFHFDNTRDAGFGVLGGPHVLALVSEVATRALKAVWHQKWQVHLRHRPEAYGGLAHVQQVGAGPHGTRAYGLPNWLFTTDAAKRIFSRSQGYLLPMAFSPGSPTHPAYGAGHATVAGACVTVLKGFFNLFEVDMMGVMKTDGKGRPIPLPLSSLKERHVPYGPKSPMKAYLTGYDGVWQRFDMGRGWADRLTIEGELNKLAHNVAMGRSMGGVHWRTDNARSLILGEALAAEILCDIANDVDEKVTFTFRTFSRKANGEPKIVVINRNGITVDGGAPISDSEL